MFTQYDSHHLTEGLICLCVEDTSFLHYFYVTHITFFLVLFLNHKNSFVGRTSCDLHENTEGGKCEGLYSLVTYDSHQKHITKQRNCTGIKKQMCVCVYSMHALACLCMGAQTQPEAST